MVEVGLGAEGDKRVPDRFLGKVFEFLQSMDNVRNQKPMGHQRGWAEILSGAKAQSGRLLGSWEHMGTSGGAILRTSKQQGA